MPEPTSSPRRFLRPRLVALLIALACLAFFILLAGWESSRWAHTIGRLGLGALAILLLALLIRVAWRRLLWRVGRRLAFSYFLVGVLPLALVALLGLLALYLLSGFLLGHRSRDTLLEERLELERIALEELAEPSLLHLPLDPEAELGLAAYRRGRRISGDEDAPEHWPAWLAERQHPADGAAPVLQLVALDDGSIGAAVTAGDERAGVLVWLRGDLAAALRERNRSWVELMPHDDPRLAPLMRIAFFGRDIVIREVWRPRDAAERAEFFRLSPPADPAAPGWLDRPFVSWIGEVGELRTLDGASTGVDLAIRYAGSPRGVFRSLLAESRQTDSTAWIALAGVAVLLFEIWAVAGAFALFMIVGISRAVNRLSGATAAVAGGDFGYRIPVRRKDQVGELQRSYNEMAEHLAQLIETAAQKEVIDKELALARSVQRDLLPDLIAPPPGVDLATTFEPSAAIGGDYFDVLERPGQRLAVVVADVAGHGLAAGLRMAMVKSALSLLAEQENDPERILERLSRLLRKGRGARGDRSLVTMTLAEFDPASGELSITNAGHPPTYIVRGGGEVEEIVLPSLPLGGLTGPLGVHVAHLVIGDSVVWISDGIPEGCSQAGEPYGYERITEALAGPVESADALKQRLLEDLRRHTGGAPIGDDRTLVVLRYTPSRASSPSAS